MIVINMSSEIKSKKLANGNTSDPWYQYSCDYNGIHYQTEYRQRLSPLCDLARQLVNIGCIDENYEVYKNGHRVMYGSNLQWLAEHRLTEDLYYVKYKPFPKELFKGGLKCYTKN